MRHVSEYRARLIPGKDFTDAYRGSKAWKDQPRFALGRVYGKIQRLLYRTRPTGGREEGFSGIFELQAYNGKPTMLSYILFLPDSEAEPLRAAFRQLEALDMKNASLVFRFEVIAERTQDTFDMRYEKVGEFAIADPLSDVRWTMPEAVKSKGNRAKKKVAR